MNVVDETLVERNDILQILQLAAFVFDRILLERHVLPYKFAVLGEHFLAAV